MVVVVMGEEEGGFQSWGGCGGSDRDGEWERQEQVAQLEE